MITIATHASTRSRLTQREQRGGDQQLVGDRVHHLAERGHRLARARDVAVEPVRQRGDHEHEGRDLQSPSASRPAARPEHRHEQDPQQRQDVGHVEREHAGQARATRQRRGAAARAGSHSIPIVLPTGPSGETVAASTGPLKSPRRQPPADERQRMIQPTPCDQPSTSSAPSQPMTTQRSARRTDRARTASSGGRPRSTSRPWQRQDSTRSMPERTGAEARSRRRSPSGRAPPIEITAVGELRSSRLPRATCRRRPSARPAVSVASSSTDSRTRASPEM